MGVLLAVRSTPAALGVVPASTQCQAKDATYLYYNFQSGGDGRVSLTALYNSHTTHVPAPVYQAVRVHLSVQCNPNLPM